MFHKIGQLKFKLATNCSQLQNQQGKVPLEASICQVHNQTDALSDVLAAKDKASNGGTCPTFGGRRLMR